jgi:hypothetical protein
MKNKDILITIDNKPAYALMLKHKVKRQAIKYTLKLDRWLVSQGHWMSDDEVAAFYEQEFRQRAPF